MLRGWTTRQWAAGAAGATLAAVLIGIPTGIIATPFYHRMTPVTWWSYPAWALTAMLEGVLLATYVRAGRASRVTTGQATTGGALSFLAVGCPTTSGTALSTLCTPRRPKATKPSTRSPAPSARSSAWRRDRHLPRAQVCVDLLDQPGSG